MYILYWGIHVTMSTEIFAWLENTKWFTCDSQMQGQQPRSNDIQFWRWIYIVYLHSSRLDLIANHTFSMGWYCIELWADLLWAIYSVYCCLCNICQLWNCDVCLQRQQQQQHQQTRCNSFIASSHGRLHALRLFSVLYILCNVIKDMNTLFDSIRLLLLSDVHVYLILNSQFASTHPHLLCQSLG